MIKEWVRQNSAQQIIAAAQIRFGLTNEVILNQINLADQDSSKAQCDDNCQRQKQFELDGATTSV
jgi:hypothetical protein